MSRSYLGLEISKDKIHVARLVAERAPKRKVVSNDALGHDTLLTWLTWQGELGALHCTLEATSTYGHAVAERLYEQGYVVSIANPKAVHDYCESRFSRTKTDAKDAQWIAEYCRDLRPTPWTPPAQKLRHCNTLSAALPTWNR
jgi:transposase